MPRSFLGVRSPFSECPVRAAGGGCFFEAPRPAVPARGVPGLARTDVCATWGRKVRSRAADASSCTAWDARGPVPEPRTARWLAASTAR